MRWRSEREINASELITQLVQQERARCPAPLEKPKDLPPSPLASFPIRVLAFLDRDGPSVGPVLAFCMAEPLDRVYTALAKHTGDGNVDMKRAKKGEETFQLTPRGLALLNQRRQ